MIFIENDIGYLDANFNESVRGGGTVSVSL